jgi:hypothetical protein
VIDFRFREQIVFAKDGGCEGYGAPFQAVLGEDAGLTSTKPTRSPWIGVFSSRELERKRKREGRRVEPA